MFSSCFTTTVLLSPLLSLLGLPSPSVGERSLVSTFVRFISLSSGPGESALVCLSYKDLARLDESSWPSSSPVPSIGGRAPNRPFVLGRFLLTTFCIYFLYRCYIIKSSSIFFTEREPYLCLANNLFAKAWFSRSILSFSLFLAITLSDLGPKVSLARFLGCTESHLPWDMSTKRLSKIWLCLFINRLRSIK